MTDPDETGSFATGGARGPLRPDDPSVVPVGPDRAPAIGLTAPAPGPAPDVVYLVRPGDRNEELRYSLRSLRNLRHGRVWLAGHRPAWVTGVEHLETEQRSTKQTNARHNLLCALGHPDVSSPFVLMNDDFYVLRRIEALPTMHRGPVVGVLKEIAHYRSGYVARMTATLELLRSWGYDEPLSYELHVPMAFDKATLLEVLERAHRARPGLVGVHYRTVYGNVHDIGGQRVDDFKLPPAREWLPSWGYLSSSDYTFPRLHRRLHRQFPTRSPYERRAHEAPANDPES